MVRRAGSKVYAVTADSASDTALGDLFASVHVDVVHFRSIGDVLESVGPESRGCLLVDPDAAQCDVAELVPELCRRGIRLPVICLSESGDVAGAVHALKAGALDFLEKPVNGQVLIDAVNEAFEVDRATRHAQEHRARLRQSFDGLTRREWDVVGPMVRGWSNRDIAEDLGLSPKTVEVYRARILAKTGCRGLTDLIRTAIRCGLSAETGEAAARGSTAPVHCRYG